MSNIPDSFTSKPIKLKLVLFLVVVLILASCLTFGVKTYSQPQVSNQKLDSSLDTGISNSSTNKAELSPTVSDFTEIELTPKNIFTPDDVKNIVSDSGFISLSLQSSFKIGSDELTDYVSKTSTDNLDDLSKDLLNSRGTLLNTMMDTEKRKADKSDANDKKSQYSIDQLEASFRANFLDSNVNFKNLKVSLKSDKADSFEQKSKSKTKVKEVKRNLLKKATNTDQATQNSASLDQNSNQSSTKNQNQN